MVYVTVDTYKYIKQNQVSSMSEKKINKCVKYRKLDFMVKNRRPGIGLRVCRFGDN